MLSLELPERMNAASVFVDAHLAAGRESKAAILCGDRVVTYRDLYEHVNRFGNALRQRDVRTEERVVLLLPDSPEFAFGFFGAMKAGSAEMQFSSGVAKEITDVIQALILFFVSADVIIRSLLRIREPVEEIKLSTGWGKQ